MLLKAVEVFFQLLENDVVLCRTGGRVAAQQALSRAAEACGAFVKAALQLIELAAPTAKRTAFSVAPTLFFGKQSTAPFG